MSNQNDGVSGKVHVHSQVDGPDETYQTVGIVWSVEADKIIVAVANPHGVLYDMSFSIESKDDGMGDLKVGNTAVLNIQWVDDQWVMIEVADEVADE